MLPDYIYLTLIHFCKVLSRIPPHIEIGILKLQISYVHLHKDFSTRYFYLKYIFSLNFTPHFPIYRPSVYCYSIFAFPYTILHSDLKIYFIITFYFFQSLYSCFHVFHFLILYFPLLVFFLPSCFNFNWQILSFSLISFTSVLDKTFSLSSVSFFPFLGDHIFLYLLGRVYSAMCETYTTFQISPK